MTNLVGTTLGQYQIVELIGEGGMASVYKAWQPNLRRYVALKVLAPHLAGDAEFVSRFHQEAVSAANLRQSNIVTIHDVGNENGYQYIAMEYIEGASLEDRIRAQHALAPEQVVDVVSQVGRALDYAHQRGFIHRDIKPANVLIDPNGRAVLTDFGIVKALTGSGLTASLTKAGAIFGTPHYMSPEQIKEEPVDHRSDLYALGIVCYEMLTGQVPFDGTTTHSILYAQAHNPPPSLRDVNPSVTPPVEAVLNRMLTKQPEGRYNSAGEFATALAQAFAGQMPAPVGNQLDGGATVVTGDRPSTGTTVMDSPPGGIVPGVSDRYFPPSYTQPAPEKRSRWPLVLGLGVVGALLVAVAVAVGVLVLPGLQGEDHLDAAQTALAEGRYDEAIEGFKQVLEDDADNVKALRGIGEAYEAQKDWEQAAIWYEQWTQVAPDDADAHYLFGQMLNALGEYERAVPEFSEVIKLNPDFVGGHRGLGRALHNLAQLEAAVEPLLKWVEMEPEVKGAWWTLGDVYERMGSNLTDQSEQKESFAKSLEAFQRWQALDMNNAESYRRIGWLQYKLEEYELAANAFENAVALQDDMADAYRGLGDSYIALKDSSLAANNYTRWTELRPQEPEAFRKLGWAYYQMGQYVDALSAFEQALELDVDLPNAHLGAGMSYKELGDCENAVIHFEAVLEQQPDNGQAKNAISACKKP